MVYSSVKLESGEWKSGWVLDYETEPIELNHIFISNCGDYNARVTGLFTGVDYFGQTRHMAEIEEFLKINMRAYLASHGLPYPCGHSKPCNCKPGVAHA